MERQLVILTKNYPFDTGEEFIENEIEILSKYFHSIIILALSCSPNSIQTRKVPDNVNVYRFCEIQNRNARYATYILGGLLFANKGCFREILKIKGIREKLFAVYLNSKVTRQFRNIVNDSDLLKRLINCDLIIYCYWFSDLPILACKLKQYLKDRVTCKIVSRAHGYDLYTERSNLQTMPFRSLVFEQIEKVFPCSEDGADYLKKRYPEFSHKIVTSYLGTKDYGVAGHNFNKKEYLIVTCSSIVPIKRLYLLAEALHYLEEKTTKQIKWICVGDGPLLENLKQYCIANLHSISVEFLGRLDNKVVMELYRSIQPDLFVNVSESEGLPVSIMEAISMGIPCLATDVGGTHEIIVDGVSGKLIPRDISPECLSKEIDKMINNIDKISGMRTVWEERFQADNNFNDFAVELLNL